MAHAVPPGSNVPATINSIEKDAPPALLGPEDQVTIHVMEEEQIPDKPFRIDNEGYLHLPMVGLIKAGGLSARELELAIADKLKFYIKDPQVTVAIAERHSRTVSLAGAVNNPGVHQVEGPQRLMEVLSMAGGLRPDAGATARITRQSEWGEIPLPNARRDLSGKFSVADVDLDSLMRGRNPEQNILIQPHDVIAVTKADLIFVLGEVKKPGGFPLMAHEKMSILSALGLAEGLFPNAASKSARILRDRTDGPNRQEIPVNLAKILQGQAPDVPLEPNDILLIPRNTARVFAIRSAEAAVTIGTGLVIWRR